MPASGGRETGSVQALKAQRVPITATTLCLLRLQPLCASQWARLPCAPSEPGVAQRGNRDMAHLATQRTGCITGQCVPLAGTGLSAGGANACQALRSGRAQGGYVPLRGAVGLRTMG